MKRLFVLALLILFITSCKNKSTEIIKNKKLVEQYFTYFNNHDWKNMANMYTSIAYFKDPSLGKNVVSQTHQQIIEKYTTLHQIFPDIRDSIVQIYTAQNNVIVEFVSKGTAPDNTIFELPICTIFTFEKGKISKDFTYYDNFEE